MTFNTYQIEQLLMNQSHSVHFNMLSFHFIGDSSYSAVTILHLVDLKPSVEFPEAMKFKIIDDINIQGNISAPTVRLPLRAIAASQSGLVDAAGNNDETPDEAQENEADEDSENEHERSNHEDEGHESAEESEEVGDA